MFLNQVQRAFYETEGYLVIKQLLDETEQAELSAGAKEIQEQAFGPIDEDGMMPYLEVASGTRILSRVEYFAHLFPLGNLIKSKKVLSILSELSDGEEVHLFKEKINYKLPGAGGFPPHIDAIAYTAGGASRHITMLLAVEPASILNGCLEVVPGSHLESIPLNEERSLEKEWCDGKNWIAVPLNTGDCLIFGSSLAHRSESNHSTTGRALVYATFNVDSQGGDMREEYYSDRRSKWPPTHQRKQGVSYEEGARLYGFASPMTTIT